MISPGEITFRTIVGIKISTQQRRWRLAVRHRLTPEQRVDDVTTICDDLVALHSSDPATVHLSAAVRMATPSIESVERTLYEDRSLVRHHAMRRTLWVMSPKIAQLAHAAATAKIARAERKRTVAAIASSTDIADPGSWLDDATAEIVELLGTWGQLTTRDIGQYLPHLVVPILFGARTKHPAAIKAHTKVLQGAGFAATLVRGRPTGSWLSSEYFWTPTESWLGEAVAGREESAAAAPLLERWLARFGPATEADITWWFGWTAGLTRKTLAAIDAVEVGLGNASSTCAGWMLTDDEPVPDPGPWVRLLPGLDPTAMGWKERDWYISPELVPRLFDRFGNAGPTVWVDGEIVGGWGQRPNGEIAMELARTLSATHQALLDETVAELDSILGDAVVRPRFPAPAQKDLFAS